MYASYCMCNFEKYAIIFALLMLAISDVDRRHAWSNIAVQELFETYMILEFYMYLHHFN